MSSHHVVREKQEPAVLVANGQIDFEVLGDLLEWSPVVVALDGAADRLHQKGIKLDVILGDFDSIEDVEYLAQAQHPVKVVHAPDQNKTDLEKGLDYLIENGHEAVHIVGMSGLRMDHTLNNFSSIAKYIDQIVIQAVDTHSRIYPVKSGFSKWFPKDRALSLMPMPEAIGVSASNLVWAVENLTLRLGTQTGSSNRVKEDGMVEITFESGVLLLFESV